MVFIFKDKNFFNKIIFQPKRRLKNVKKKKRNLRAFDLSNPVD